MREAGSSRKIRSESDLQQWDSRGHRGESERERGRQRERGRRI